MLLSLSNNCLRIIIKQLKLKDQISCYFVCQHLKNVVTGIWQSKKKVCIDRYIIKDIPLEHVIEYINCMNEHVENLWLYEVDLYYLQNIKFPKVHSLFYDNYDNHSPDNEQFMKNLFPNLTKLRLEGDFTGNNLQDLTNLESLEFYICENLEEKYFENIYSKLTKIKKLSFYNEYSVSDELLKNIVLCETLEEISIDEDHFLRIYEKLFELKKLRKITCFYDSHLEDILTYITNNFGDVVHTIEFTKDLDWVYIDFYQSLQKLVALRKLIFYDTKIPDDQICTIAAAFSSTLEEFHFRNNFANDSKYYDMLLEIVRRCTKLKIFDLTNTDIDLSFVKKVAAIIASDDNKEQNQILIMNCSRTKVKIEDLNTLQLSEKLQISFEYKDYERENEYYKLIHCEWNTPEDN